MVYFNYENNEYFIFDIADIEKRAQSEGISINSFVLGLLMDGLLLQEKPDVK